MTLTNPIADVSQNVLTPPVKVITVDTNGNYEGGGTAASPSYTRLEDGLTPGNVATVAQFHNADNQAPGGTAYGLLTGGVAQLLNYAGNLDRQRETGIDGASPLGIATGAAQFAMVFKTTDSTDNFAAGTRTFTPVAMSGTIQGVAWSIQAGSVLSLDSGANQEYVIVTAVTSTTFTCITTKAHNGTGTPFPIVGFVYNQERDAAGEVDGATGIGTAVAAAYEFNGGGPLNNSSAISNLQFDRARNVQALGLGSGTISNNPLAAGSTTLTLNSAPTTLQPGMPIILDRAGSNPETNYVALTYTVGSTSVPLQNATANAHNQNTTVEWGQHSPLGAQLNGFLPWGLGAEEEVIYDPVSKKYFVEVAATGDGNSGQNLVLESIGLFNGTTFDRLKGDGGVARVSLQSQGTPVTGSAAVAVNTSNSASLPAVASKTNYITGFSVTTQGGSAAAAGAVTITGTITGTLTFEVGGAAGNPVQVFVQFPSPIPASATNTAITVNVPALGANTGAAACTIYGFVQ